MRKTLLACVITAMVVGAGSATAASLITGKDVKNNSLTGADIKNLRCGDFEKKARARICGAQQTAASLQTTAGSTQPASNGRDGAPGPKGDQGKQGDKGEKGDRGEPAVRLVNDAQRLGFTNAFTGADEAPSFKNDMLDLSTQGQRVGVNIPVESGTRLADLSGLTYRAMGNSTTLAAYVRMVIDTNGAAAGGTTSLFFEPEYQNGYGNSGKDLQANVFQTWDTLSGTWWVGSDVPNTEFCSPVGPNANTPCGFAAYNHSFEDYVNAFPDAVITEAILRTGGGWPAFTGGVDYLKLGVGDSMTVFDFAH